MVPLADYIDDVVVVRYSTKIFLHVRYYSRLLYTGHEL